MSLFQPQEWADVAETLFWQDYEEGLALCDPCEEHPAQGHSSPQDASEAAGSGAAAEEGP